MVTNKARNRRSTHPMRDKAAYTPKRPSFGLYGVPYGSQYVLIKFSKFRYDVHNLIPSSHVFPGWFP
jgi:hypothetical protein